MCFFLPVQHLEEPSTQLYGQGRCSSACHWAEFLSVSRRAVTLTSFSHFFHSCFPLEDYAPFQQWLSCLGWIPQLVPIAAEQRDAAWEPWDAAGSANTVLCSSPYFTPLSNSALYHPNVADVHPKGDCSVSAGGINPCICDPYVVVRLYGNLGSNRAPEAAAGTCSTPSIHQPCRNSAQWHAVMK